MEAAALADSDPPSIAVYGWEGALDPLPHKQMVYHGARKRAAEGRAPYTKRVGVP